MKIVLRFKGGCGGNFLKSQLYQHTTTTNYKMNSNNNGYFFKDVPFEMFLKYTVPFDVCDRYNIPYETQWYEISQQKAEQVINDILANTDDSILAMHLVFKKNFDHSRVFDLYELIDSYPTENGFWITQTLQFYKSAFVREYRLPKKYREGDDKRLLQINQYHQQHGWYPSYWGWIIESPINEDLEDVNFFIKKHGSSKKWQQKLNQLFYTGREYIIQGEKFIFDVDALIYKDMCNTWNIKPKQSIIEKINQYTSNNIEIFKTLGLYNKINNTYDNNQQIDILKQTFLPIYEELTRR